jgi:hypothetical protein
MNGVVSVISRPEEAMVGSTVWPRRSVKYIPIEVSVAVYVTDSEPKRLKRICVAVNVGSASAPPIDEPPKYASALELMFSNVAWTL